MTSHTFDNSAALVTGAAAGMGCAAARAFAKEGATVALADVNATAVEAAAKKLNDAGLRLLQ